MAEPLGQKDIHVDPATDYMVQKYTTKLGDPVAEGIRNAKLFAVLTHNCRGVSPRNAVWWAYARKHRREWHARSTRQSQFLADSNLNLLDDYAVQHLCVVAGYLYGPRGVLIPNIVSIQGKPAMRHVSKPGYFRGLLP